MELPKTLRLRRLEDIGVYGERRRSWRSSESDEEPPPLAVKRCADDDAEERDDDDAPPILRRYCCCCCCCCCCFGVRMPLPEVKVLWLLLLFLSEAFRSVASPRWWSRSVRLRALLGTVWAGGMAAPLIKSE